MRGTTNKFIIGIKPNQGNNRGLLAARKGNIQLEQGRPSFLTQSGDPGMGTTTDLFWNSSSNILNLSTLFQPNKMQRYLLEKGLTFIPNPVSFDGTRLRGDLHHYHRRIKLIDYFKDNTSNAIPFTLPSNWEPPWNAISEKIKTLIHVDIQGFNNYTPLIDKIDPLTVEYRKAIRGLQNNGNIVIKPADKGSKIVIMDRQQYALEAHRQLNDTKYYKIIDNSMQDQTQKHIHNIVQKLYHDKFISAKQRDFLFGSDPPRNRQFYLLPKIHKDPLTWTVPYVVPPGRPIVSDCNSVTYNISLYIDSFLGPLSCRHPSYLKDTYHFIDTIRLMNLPTNALLFTIDIDSLYTNIDTDMGLRAVQHVFDKYPDNNRPDSELLQLLEICLKNNDFEFNNKQYLQVSGTAMGHRYAPSYANIYMSEWEREALEKCPLKPIFYLRFLDDIIGAWEHGRESFHDFIDILNNHHSSIKVKYTIDSNEINFLDTTVFFEHVNKTSKKLLTRVYFKPTDTHALLHKTSYHPKHTFKGIVKSQIIRFYRISSRETDLNHAISILFHSLRRRGYSRRFLRYVKKNTLTSLTSPHSSAAPPFNTDGWRSSDGEHHKNPNVLIPLITTYSKPYLDLQNFWKNNYLKTMANDTQFEDHKVISAFRKNKNLRDLLVRAKFGEPGKKEKGNKHWAFKPKRFLFNPYGGTGSPSTGELHLNSSNLVYCITCEFCGKMYVGETGNTLLNRLKQHIYSIEKGRLSTPLVQHFQTHCLQYLSITGIQTCVTWTEGQRRRQESLWIQKLKTMVPMGLNY